MSKRTQTTTSSGLPAKRPSHSAQLAAVAQGASVAPRPSRGALMEVMLRREHEDVDLRKALRSNSAAAPNATQAPLGDGSGDEETDAVGGDEEPRNVGPAPGRCGAVQPVSTLSTEKEEKTDGDVRDLLEFQAAAAPGDSGADTVYARLVRHGVPLVGKDGTPCLFMLKAGGTHVSCQLSSSRARHKVEHCYDPQNEQNLRRHLVRFHLKQVCVCMATHGGVFVNVCCVVLLLLLCGVVAGKMMRCREDDVIVQGSDVVVPGKDAVTTYETCLCLLLVLTLPPFFVSGKRDRSSR